LARPDNEHALAFFEKLKPWMTDGDLSLTFQAGEAILYWKTAAGRGFQVDLNPTKGAPECTDDQLQDFIAQLRKTELKQGANENSGVLSVDGVVRSAMNAVSTFATTEVWYRGQPSESMKLLPRVFRREETMRAEGSMATRFIAGAPSRYANCPDDTDAVSWLPLMQHFGLPTRLLDWTMSALVAAFFAVSDEKYESEHGIIWALHPGRLNETALGLADQICYMRSPKIAPLLAGASGGNPQYVEQVAAVAPPEVDLRLLLQHGRFTLHGSARPL
jgi:hypothetical protein